MLVFRHGGTLAVMTEPAGPTPCVVLRVRWLLAACLCVVALALALSGCSSNVNLNSAFVLEPQDVDKATERGISLLNQGTDPYSVYSWSTKNVNERVSSDVVVEYAALCFPKDEISFAIANQKDPADGAVKRAVNEALKRTRTEVKFSVVLEVADTRDPKSLKDKDTFEMLTNTGTEPYPPLYVEAPVFIRKVSDALDPTAPPSSLYGYDVHFPLRGSPGYPPIDTSVTTLYLVVKDGQSESRIPFDLTAAANKRYGGSL
jgi:hypothetical protein